MNLRFLTCLAALAAVLVTGCGERSQSYGRVDPDHDDVVGGTGTESGDVRAMCDQFCRTILEVEEVAGAAKAPRVALLSVDNRVNDVTQRIDADLLLTKMRAQLNQSARGRLRFLDRANVDAIRREKEAMDRGEVTRSSAKALSGADFFMTGEIRSLSKTSEAGQSTYLVYAFRLVDSQSSEIVWEDLYEQKRVAERGAVYR
ncbi:MAG: hypothetical protein H0W72_06420 [Planctomycetes bacterium]|nr:hypothetical protein [Planctomycetota bacterium]